MTRIALVGRGRVGVPPLTPNLPGGMTLFLEETWASTDFAVSAFGTSGFSTPLSGFGATTSVIADPTGTVPEGTNVGEMHFASTFTDGYGPEWNSSNVAASGYSEFYVAYRVYLTPNYVVHTGDEKYIWPRWRIRESPNTERSAGHLYLSNNPDRSDDGPSDALASQGIWRDPFDTYAPMAFGANDGPTLTKGQWHTVEYLVQAQTGTGGVQATDAVLRVWIDGVQQAEVTGVSLNTRAEEAAYGQTVLKTLGIYGIRGGGTSSVPVPAEGQSKYYGHIVMYGKV